MNDEQRREIVRAIKDPASRALFSIRDEQLRIIGRLRPITVETIDDDDLIRTMAEHRTKNGRYFLTRFDVSPENKRAWLERGVIANDDRVLFLVETAEGEVVGQDGFTLHGGGEFELNGTMRWAPGGERGLFARCGAERAGICFYLLGCTLSRTEVFSDNEANMRNSLLMGHDIVCEHELFLSERDGMLSYRKIADGRTPNTDRKLTELAMTREVFAQRHPEIAAHPQVHLHESR